jgi:oligopeptide/dipeptide ABC transporter ATP-binding protein
MMMEQKDIVLDVKKLNTSFVSDGKTVRIVKDVSFQLKRGKTLAIVGESGCGKSVTVHSIVKLLPQNARFNAEQVLYRQLDEKTGKITEFDISKMDPKGKEMRSLRGADLGMVFQDPMSSLNPVYKVGDQVAEALMEHNKGMKKKEALEKVLDMFRKLGIPDPEGRLQDFPHQFSGGMKQRVVIAIAMINNPEIIIADEPTTALDVTIQAQIMELMKELQLNFGKSIILITHNMGLVAEQADEVCVMYMGRIVEFGTLDQIFENPSHPYTQALLRSVPVLGLADDQKLETIPGATPNPATLGVGCEFADRCPECSEACKAKDVPAFEIEPGHRVRCVKFSQYKEVD